MNKQQVYISKTISGIWGFFTCGRLVIEIDEDIATNQVKALALAERYNFRLVL